MTRMIPVGAMASITAGCFLWPQPAPPVPREEAALAREATAMEVGVDVSLAALGAAGRKLQSVGGASAVGSYNDISILLVGLFDEGSTAAPSFGYKYSSAFGTSVTSSNVATIAGSSWLSDLQTRMDSETTADHTVNRRYLTREYTSSVGSASSISVAFSKVPKTSQHGYRAWAAAYDADGNNLGFVTAQIAAASISANTSFTAASLTLTLNSNLFTGTLTQAATVSNVYPEAL